MNIYIILGLCNIIWLVCAGYATQLTIVTFWRMKMRDVVIQSPKFGNETFNDNNMGGIFILLITLLNINIRILLGPFWLIYAIHQRQKWRKSDKFDPKANWYPPLFPIPYTHFSEDVSI